MYEDTTKAAIERLVNELENLGQNIRDVFKPQERELEDVIKLMAQALNKERGKKCIFDD